MKKYGVRCIDEKYGNENCGNHFNEWIDITNDGRKYILFGTKEECIERISHIGKSISKYYEIAIKNCAHDIEFCHCPASFSKEEVGYLIEKLDL